MYFLLFLIILAVVYVKSFETDFTKEHLDKVKPALAIVSVIVILSTVLNSMV